MKEVKKLSVHIVLLLVAATAAFLQTRPDDDAPAAIKPGEVELWGGTPKDIKLIRYKNKKLIVMLEGKSDAAGQWFLGHVEPNPDASGDEEQVDEEPKNPHNPHAKKSKPAKVEPATFAAVTTAEKLAKKLAPFRAKRAIGEIDKEREEVYGLHEPEGWLTVEVLGKKHELTIGGPAPGTGDRYARDDVSGIVYVIDATIVRELQSGSGRLKERKLHGWKAADVQRAEIISTIGTRTAVRSGTKGRRFWADPSAPDTNDETVKNWLAKVDRLSASKYIDKRPDGAERIMRIEYHGEGKRLGHVELHRLKGEGDEKDTYIVTSEQLRLYAEVARQLAEQVADDMPSVFPNAPNDDAADDDGGENADPEKAPADDKQGAPTKDAPTKGAPAKGAPAKGAPAKGAPGDDAPPTGEFIQ